MEDSPELHVSEFGEDEDKEDEEVEANYQEEANMLTDTMESSSPNLHEDPDQDADIEWNSYPCQHCERHFTSKQGLEHHIHIHALANSQTHKSDSKNCKKSFISESCHQQQEKKHGNANSGPSYSINPVDSPGSATETGGLDTSSSNRCSGAPILVDKNQSMTQEEHGVPEWGHACKYCEKVFSTHTNKRRHERRIHERHLRLKRIESRQVTQEANQEGLSSTSTGQEANSLLSDLTTAVPVQGNEGPHAGKYMLDISSNISENLSFYIDGKIVSTSTVGSCEVVEVNSGLSTLVGLDTLILDPTQICQSLNADLVTGKDILGQPLARRRTATPPLLPQIKTELESEVVVSSSSSSLVPTLIENLLPQSTESTVVQKERTVFLSPKLKQLLEKQDGLKPTLALITEGHKLGSPLSLSVLPAGTGRFKRRTGSPPSSPQQNLTSHVDKTKQHTGDSDTVSAVQTETECCSPPHKEVLEIASTTPPQHSTAPVEEPIVNHILPESWPSITGGNSCNQQPLDLSNALKRNEDVALAEAALDLSLQKRSPDDLELTSCLVTQPPPKKKKPNTCMLEKVLMNEYANDVGEQCVRNPEIPLVADFAIVTGSDMVTPVEPVTEGLVYGLTLPSASLTPSSASLNPVALQPASPCTIALAAPVSHSVLPAAPSLITVLAPPTSIPNPSNQAIQVFAPNIAPEPLVICTENTLNPSECDLSAAFTSTNPSNLVTLTQPLDPTLNLPGHVFLTDQIALNAPVVESAVGSEVPFSPAVTLNDSLINSYNISSNAVLIECTIALEAPGNIVPTAITLQENTAPPPPTQMVVNHIEQQQMVSLPDPQNVDPSVLDPTLLMSPIAESVTTSTTSAVLSDCPTLEKTSSDPEPVVNEEQPSPKEEETADESISAPESSVKKPTSPEPTEVAEEPSDDALSDAQQETFTKNFICNVCDKLFHSMKELGHHVSDHADDWPYKCEFCVLLFGKPSALLEHRSALHGVGKTYVCSACTKEFVYLCNLKHHQEELHPGQQCTYTEEEKGKLRPQNYNNSSKVNTETSVPSAPEESKKSVKKEEGKADAATEELLTTIKVMASDGGKLKGPDVRLGINQHYPSFKPPPFPYHNRSPTGSVASATNFTTHNIPQTFSTAIRCTKCGKSFDNMPELHKHILACANASDKRRYTPKKNPIPLRHFAKTQNGVLSSTNSTNGLNASHRASQANRSKSNQEPPVKVKLTALGKRKKKLVQRAMSQRNKSASSSNTSTPTKVEGEQKLFVCLYCSREFTLSRSRTKHMAVCPKKPEEVRKRKDGGVYITKENNGHLRRGSTLLEEKRQASTRDHKTRVQASGPAKRSTILPVQSVVSNKTSKIIIKETVQPKQETPTLNEIPIRTFNPPLRQYGRMQHGVKEIPIKITIVKPQQTGLEPRNDDIHRNQRREEAARAVATNLQSSATGSAKAKPMATEQKARNHQITSQNADGMIIEGVNGVREYQDAEKSWSQNSS